MEFNKGILFIRISGSLTKYCSKEFRSEVFPVILKHEFKYIVLNLENVNTIDKKGFKSLIDLNSIVSSWNGRTSICNLTNNIVKNYVEENGIYDYYYNTNDELSAIGVFKI
jgi:anti-anti-sigma factor